MTEKAPPHPVLTLTRRRSLPFAVGVLVMSATITPLAGCATMTQSEIKALETRELDLPYDEAYMAALNAMFGMGLSIEHTDKASGIMTGQVGDHIQRASAAALLRPLYPVKKVTLMVSPIAARLTQLRMKVLINEKPQLDRKLMTSIWQQIEREALLESRPVDRQTGPTGPP